MNLKAILVIFSLLVPIASSAKGKLSKAREREQTPFTKELKRQQELGKDENPDENMDHGYFNKIVNFKAISGSFDKFLQSTTIKLSQQLFKTDLGSSILGAKYRIEDRPSYIGGNFTRADIWRFNFDTNVLDMFLDPNIGDFGLNQYVNFGFELFFARQHKTSRPKTLIKKPIMAWKIPLTAKKAKKLLKVQDFFAIPMHLDVGATIGVDGPINPSISAGVNYNQRFGRSDFLVTVYRESENLFNIKVIGIKRKGHGLFATVDLFKGLIGDDFFSELILKKLIKTKIFDMRIQSSEKGSIHFSDFTLDLNNEDAKESYNKLFKRIFTFDRLKVLNPFIKRSTARRIFDDIAKPLLEVSSKNPEAVKNNFVGSFKFNNDPFHIRFGNRLAYHGRSKNYVENKVRFKNKEGEEIHFLNTFLDSSVETSFFWRVIRMLRYRSTSMNLYTDENFNIEESKPSDYRLTDEFIDNSASVGDQKEYVSEIKNTFGPTVSTKFPWKDLVSKSKQSKLRIRSEIILKSEALNLIRSTYSVEEILELFEFYLQETQTTIDYIFDLPMISWMYGSSKNDKEEISALIHQGLHTKRLPKKQIIDAEGNNILAGEPEVVLEEDVMPNYVLLEDKKLFRRKGIGFINYLIEYTNMKLEDSLFAKVSWSSKEKGEQTFTYGKDISRSKLYNTLEFALSILGGRAFSVRAMRKSMYKDNLR